MVVALANLMYLCIELWENEKLDSFYNRFIMSLADGRKKFEKREWMRETEDKFRCLRPVQAYSYAGEGCLVEGLQGEERSEKRKKRLKKKKKKGLNG